jgi:hypothetical protein
MDILFRSSTATTVISRRPIMKVSNKALLRMPVFPHTSSYSHGPNIQFEGFSNYPDAPQQVHGFAHPSYLLASHLSQAPNAVEPLHNSMSRLRFNAGAAETRPRADSTPVPIGQQSQQYSHAAAPSLAPGTRSLAAVLKQQAEQHRASLGFASPQGSGLQPSHGHGPLVSDALGTIVWLLISAVVNK